MRVSIIVPIYRVEKEIERCLRSVIEQDYLDIELVIVNDCTPDNSFVIAEEFLKKHHFLHNSIVLEHQRNEGLSVARNTGMSVATGDYLFFLDSDDNLSNKTVISFLVNCASTHKYPDLVIGSYQYIVNDCVEKEHLLQDHFYTTNKDLYRDFTGRGIYWAAWGRLIKRDLVRKNELAFKPRLYSEDILWSYHLFRVARSAYICSNIVYDYYNRPGSIMSSLSKKHIEDLAVILNDIYHCYQNDITSDKNTARLIERYRRMYLKYAFSLKGVERVYLEEKLQELKNIQLPCDVFGNFKYLRQNILLRMPIKYIFFYLKWKWSSNRHKH